MSAQPLRVWLVDDDASIRWVLERAMRSDGILPQVFEAAEPVLAAARSDATKARLRSQTEEAERRGLFGAPTFITADGELFWGNDRLDQALRWAKHAR